MMPYNVYQVLCYVNGVPRASTHWWKLNSNGEQCLSVNAIVPGEKKYNFSDYNIGSHSSSQVLSYVNGVPRASVYWWSNNINGQFILNVDVLVPEETKKYLPFKPTDQKKYNHKNSKPSNYQQRKFNKQQHKPFSSNHKSYEKYIPPHRREPKQSNISNSESTKPGQGKEPLMIRFISEQGDEGFGPGGEGMSALNQLFSSIFKQPERSNTKLIAPIEKETKFDLVKEYDKLPFKVEGLEDLIKLSKYYKKNKPDQFGINMKRLYDISSSLEKLNNVIGMQNVKQLVAEKVITYLQGLGDYDDMLHIVLTAPPGYGKTMISYLLSEIFFKLGIIKKQENKKTKNESQPKSEPETDKLEDPNIKMEKNIMSMLNGQDAGSSSSNEKDKKYRHPITNEKIDFPFVLARRSDLIGKYVGHTAPKVEDMVKKSLGGVLVIDEAYSLGRDDTYSDEAINALNQMLSEYAGQFICIIAGYEKELKKNFFTNPGLERRFRLKIKLEQYTPKELTQIFIKMVNDSLWKVSFNIKWMEEFIEENKDSFKFAGGDLLNLLQCCKDSHSKRVLGKHPKTKKGINKEDIEEGFKIYKSYKNNNNKNSKLSHMYI